MAIFTVDISGRPTVVFAAQDLIHAFAFVNDEFVRAELCGLRTPDGEPLRDGKADMKVRSASVAEQAVWERNLIQDLSEGVHESREDAIESNGFAFLVDYLEPDE